MPRVARLFLYPVKSTRRVELEEAWVDERGLRGDRRWLVVDPEGKFKTQREVACLATVRAEPGPNGLKLAADGACEITVVEPKGPTIPVVVWQSTVDAIDAGDEVAQWLTHVIGEDARLVYMPDRSVRPVHPDFAKEGDHVSFADGFPCLLTNTASLENLNTQLETPVPMERFRPNIVVEGFVPWAEDGWSKVKIGEAEFRCPKPSGRCIVTTTDQDTGERSGPEPLTTLYQVNLIGQAAVFGANLSPDTLGRIRVGDPVSVE